MAKGQPPKHEARVDYPTIDPGVPEWASRLLKIREVAAIVGENPATVYRKIDAEIYPHILHIGSSSRIRGWELWECIKVHAAK